MNHTLDPKQSALCLIVGGLEQAIRNALVTLDPKSDAAKDLALALDWSAEAWTRMQNNLPPK